MPSTQLPTGRGTASSVDRCWQSSSRGARSRMEHRNTYSSSGVDNELNYSRASADELKELLSDHYYSSQGKNRHYDEIFRGLFLGDMRTARNVSTLQKLGITHVLNVAYSPSPYVDPLHPNEAYYREHDFDCHFFGIPAQDCSSYKISQWFDESSEFIHEAIKSEGKVFVHCQVGVSRSATLVLAYLMIKHRMTALEAVRLVGARRPILPNDGFLKQLCELEHRLLHPRNILLRTLIVISRKTFRTIFRISPKKPPGTEVTRRTRTDSVPGKKDDTSFSSRRSLPIPKGSGNTHGSKQHSRTSSDNSSMSSMSQQFAKLEIDEQGPSRHHANGSKSTKYEM